MKNCMGSVDLWRIFLLGLVDAWRPSLNVAGTIVWSRPWDWLQRREKSGHWCACIVTVLDYGWNVSSSFAFLLSRLPCNDGLSSEIKHFLTLNYFSQSILSYQQEKKLGRTWYKCLDHMFLFLWPEFLHHIFPALQNMGRANRMLLSNVTLHQLSYTCSFWDKGFRGYIYRCGCVMLIQEPENNMREKKFSFHHGGAKD